MADTNQPTDKQKSSNGARRGRVENLKPFAPGQSGNPKGRPKNEFSLTALLRQAMEKDAIDGVKIPAGKTVAQALVERVVELALTSNDFRYVKEIWDRMDGKVPDKIEVNDARSYKLEWEDADSRDSDADPAPGPAGG